MYEINIKIPKKRIGVVNKIRKLLETSYKELDIAECTCNQADFGQKELGINFEIKEREEN